MLLTNKYISLFKRCHPFDYRRLRARCLPFVSFRLPERQGCHAWLFYTSWQASGTRMLNGIGGSGDFIRNAYISTMHCPSCRATKVDEFGITGVVPKVPHVDHTEHDIDVLVTEQGLADCRGLAPIDRARVIIDKCAHPAYRDYMHDYADRGIKATGGHHEPHLLDECYKMHTNFIEKGTMRFWEK